MFPILQVFSILQILHFSYTASLIINIQCAISIGNINFDSKLKFKIFKLYIFLIFAEPFYSLKCKVQTIIHLR